MSSPSKPLDLNFFSAFFGLVLAPPETTANLLRAKKYHFAVLMLVFLLTVVFTPFAVRIYTANHFLYKLDVLRSFVLATTIGFFLFILFEVLFLRFLGIRPRLANLISVICFALAPILMLVLVIYVLNIWASGTTHYLTFFLNGHASVSAACIRAAFWAKTVCFILSGLVFMYGIKYSGDDMYTSNALIVTIFSLIPLLAAFFLGVIITDFALPGTANMYRQLITTPTYLLNV